MVFYVGRFGRATERKRRVPGKEGTEETHLENRIEQEKKSDGDKKRDSFEEMANP